MARWYAKFDGGAVSALDSAAATGGFFEKLRVGANSASAALLRDGLIASRSAVSSDVYDDLDSANRDGSKGTYFPPNISTLPTATLISWSTAYSSSVDGIKTPTSNTYGVSDSLNYSLRPTGSVLSTQPTLVGPTDPLDPVQLNYNVYLSASNAVKTVIDTFQTASTATGFTPYTRGGVSSSRTLHSIWHNPTLDYFGWDDFTPGTGLTTGISTLGNSPLSVIVSVVTSQATYKNDVNPNGYIGFLVSIEGGTVVTSLQLLANQTHTPAGGYIQIGSTYSGQTGPANPSGVGNSSWSWDGVGNLTWQITLPAGTYTIEADSEFYDVTTKFGGGRGSVTSISKTVT